MQNLVVVESSHDVEHAVYGLDVREEGIPESFALRRAFYEARNVGYLEVGCGMYLVC